jgi:multidrug efflux pump subunit AcrA (membrane-fusion protein)
MKPFMMSSTVQEHIYRYDQKSRVRYWFWGIVITLFLFLFLPWTQNIRSKGRVTTLRPEQRPQQINTIIGGRIVRWKVKEGDRVKKGDTLLQLTEVKEAYLDPQLVQRTGEQLDAKQRSVSLYQSKAYAAGAQLQALEKEQQLKLEQNRNKLEQQSRKIEAAEQDLQAAINEVSVANRQLRAGQEMFEAGAISLIDLERRKVNEQNVLAKKVSAENKLANEKQERIILEIELNSIKQSYAEKIAKTQGDQLQAQSEAAGGEAESAKLQNLYANYSIRNDMYFILAPQDGQVINARKAGIGEIVKEGERILDIVPDIMQKAVELFIRPLDLPLVNTGQRVRFWFDGFPAIVFSGWPQASYGTFGGIISAVERNVNEDGKFRILVAEDPNDKPWPAQLRMGAGAQGMALLKEVPIWYELWRNINGFPPDYYQPQSKSTTK